MKNELYTVYIKENTKEKYFDIFGFYADGEQLGIRTHYDDLNKRSKMLKSAIQCTENGFKIWKKYGGKGIDYESLVADISKSDALNSKEKFPIVYL
jgi:hypothetical protein